MRIFVTGGAGFIGSHTLYELLRQCHDVCVFDNFANSSPEALKRVRLIANAGFDTIEGDITDEAFLSAALSQFQPDGVIHFAGLKAVGESNEKPVHYYQTNVGGSLSLLKAMDAAGCRRIVFSSSATVYGAADYLPYDEDHLLKPVNPYGRSKYFAEQIIRDWCSANGDASAVLLRYFNPVGAHESGMIGEDPTGIPNNLMPFVAKVAIGKLPAVNVFGQDYETRDGTGERDYIHVTDLARAHLAAIEFTSDDNKGCESINVGTGKGTTVLEMIEAMEAASGKQIPRNIVGRRSGDVASSVAAVNKARELLGWEARLGIDEMCRSVWNWQSKNPDGYR